MTEGPFTHYQLSEEYHWWTGVTFPFVHAAWTGTESLFVIDGHLKTTDVEGNVSF